jgi:RHS repeat-associated protein
VIINKFAYDELNRLKTQTVLGQGMIEVEYDLLGNITSKTGVGDYDYDLNRPHVLLSAGSATYTYDLNGNNLTGDGRTLQYTTFDKPFEITKGGHATSFAYGPDRARYRRIDVGIDGTTTTRYIGNVEIIFHPDGTEVRKRYLAGVAIESRTIVGTTESGRTTHYIHKDHLGSLDVATDASGEVYQWFSFDAWGERRNALDWNALSPQDAMTFAHNLTTRGFTGHEMLDEVGLIHMNGRIYDPKLGRFLQADPLIQDPTNSQSLNRYSYVWNNPLNATDPSGHLVFSLLAMLIAGAEFAMADLAIYAFAGFADALVAGGSFKDALLSGIAAGVSAGAFSKVGGALAKFKGDFAANLSGIGFSIKVVSHGVIGGITSVIQGGKFGHGFASGAFTAAATSFNNSQFIPGEGFSRTRVVIGAAIGGTASKMTGGKFANGAITGAFSQALNNEKRESVEASNKNQISTMQEQWNEFVENEDSITAEWNKDNYPAPFRVSSKKFWRKILSKVLIEAYEYHDWQINKLVYNQGMDSFEAYRMFPPSGHVQRQFGEWRAVIWKNYDFGGTVKQTVDFYYWHNDMGYMRPADCYISGSC